uniref:Uncharacterized protein n=1 Tax=Parascaris univalens TaxID=6257 RepID=A0A915A2A3_PARUN
MYRTSPTTLIRYCPSTGRIAGAMSLFLYHYGTSTGKSKNPVRQTPQMYDLLKPNPIVTVFYIEDSDGIPKHCRGDTVTSRITRVGKFRTIHKIRASICGTSHSYWKFCLRKTVRREGESSHLFHLPDFLRNQGCRYSLV